MRSLEILSLGPQESDSFDGKDKLALFILKAAGKNAKGTVGKNGKKGSGEFPPHT